MIVSGSFLFLTLETKRGRSCWSFLPSRILPYLCGLKWNENVADYMLLYHPTEAQEMIQNYLMIRRTQEYRNYHRTWQQQQQQQNGQHEQQQGSTQNPPSRPPLLQFISELVVTPSLTTTRMTKVTAA
ncbi:hypothetical protein IV203_002392 [Nitzschia inconspicua]|nr:hypothetical protein IV203_002392 [Nitzschia inconspicua]